MMQPVRRRLGRVFPNPGVKTVGVKTMTGLAILCLFLIQALPAAAGPGTLQTASDIRTSFQTLISSENRPVEADDMRDFPPLVDPERKEPARAPREPRAEEPIRPMPPDTSGVPYQGAPARPASGPGGLSPYLLGVGDEVELVVIGQPDYSRVLRVRPDGNITAPGAGTLFALGRTPEEVGLEIEQKLSQYLRHPRVSLMVNNYGERHVYVLGEVELPGEKTYSKGMSALQAIAQAGGMRPSAKGKSVIVLRRTGPEQADYYPLDLGNALKDGGGALDMSLQPADIVFVPRSFIGNANVFVDQYFRQMISPFTLYLEGWNAFNIGERGVRVITTQ